MRSPIFTEYEGWLILSRRPKACHAGGGGLISPYVLGNFGNEGQVQTSVRELTFAPSGGGRIPAKVPTSR